MICDVCLSGRHVRCRGCDCGMCRLKKERRGTPTERLAPKPRAPRKGPTSPNGPRQPRAQTARQHAMIPDLYSMGLPYEDIVELLGIKTDRPAVLVRRIMKKREDERASVVSGD